MKNKISSFNWYRQLAQTEFDSIGEDLILLENPDMRSTLGHPIKMNITTTIICFCGNMEGYINMEKYCLKPSSILTLSPEHILQIDCLSEDFFGLYLMMSNDFLSGLPFDAKEKLLLFRSIRSNPVTSIDNDGMETLKNYCNILQNVVRSNFNPRRIEISQHLIMAFFYSLGYKYYDLHKIEKKTKKMILADNFFEHLKQCFKEQRSVDFYAKKLNITPKYLSKIIKETSGKTVSENVNDYVILEAKALLKSTNLTIQQISDSLNFSSQSVFGKYFKRQVGLSPSEYSEC